MDDYESRPGTARARARCPISRGVDERRFLLAKTASPAAALFLAAEIRRNSHPTRDRIRRFATQHAASIPRWMPSKWLDDDPRDETRCFIAVVR